MSYAQLHVHAMANAKVATLSHGAFRLWISGLCYCQAHLTDGVLRTESLPTLLVRGWARYARELVAAGLWHEGPDGYTVHDYLDWNTSRAEVEKKRALAKQRWERFRTGKQTGANGVANALPTRTQRNAVPKILKRGTTASNNGAPPTDPAPSKGKPRHQPSTAGMRTCPHEPACASYRACRDKALAEAKHGEGAA